MKLIRVTNSSFNKLKQLVIKAISARGTYTAETYAPYGTDARPVKDTTVIYSTTERDGDEAIMGCLNKNLKAEIGEHRLFCTDEQGAFKFSIWLRANGEVLIGDSEIPAEYTNFAVLYNESKAEQDKLKATVNDLVNKWNAFCASYTPGSPSTLGTPPTLASSTVTPNTSNFALTKNEKIKFNS